MDGSQHNRKNGKSKSPASPTAGFAAIRESILAQNGKEYWRSIEEHADTPEFREFIAQEYPHEIEHWDNTLSRRNFVKVMGASFALAGLSGCVIQPPEKIVAPVRSEENYLPGRPKFVATAMTLGGVATGLLAKSYEGRPIKLEGNPEHPGSKGATDVLAQAAILGMYDPDRSQEIIFRGAPSTWERFMTEFRTAIDENRRDGGAGVRVLTETVTSPTLIDQMTKVKAELPNMKWVQYEPVNSDNAMAGARMAFGSPVQTIYKFDKAERILTLDADVFSGFNVGYIKDYAKGKAYSESKKTINRLYAIETTMTITGAKADHRLGVKPSQMVEIAKAIAAAVGLGASSTYTENAAWFAAMAKDLNQFRGRSLVVAGDNCDPMVHALAHAINGALGNVGQTLVYADPFSPGSERTQLEQYRELISEIDAGVVKMLVIMGGNPVYNTPADIRLTADRLSKVPMRVHLGHYVDETAEHCHWHVPEKHFLESWSDARAYDGTASIVQPLIAPLYDGKNAHEVMQLFMTEGFDKRDYDIVKEYWQRTNIAAAPPLVAKTETVTESHPAAAASHGQGHETTSHEATAPPAPSPSPSPLASPSPAPRATPATAATGGTTAATAAVGAGAPAAPARGGNFEDNWRRAVHDGVIFNTAAAAKTVSANTSFLTQPMPARANSGGGLEISILPDPCVHDGRFVNNGWLQELPNPLNKITWDNVALVSPRTAKRLGLNTGNDDREFAGGAQGTSFINTKGGNQFSDLVTLNYQGADIKQPVPVWVQPGQPDDVVTIYMGYGRTRAGRVGTGLGYNAFDVRRSDAMSYGFGGLTATGEKTQIASTQIHFNMEGRDLLRTWNLENIEQEIVHGKQEDFYPKSMYQTDHQETYAKHTKWAMSIDLNSCVGCNACVIACQAENNIPVVGKEQVNRSREMHWLRIDAYYSGDINNPNGPHFQPLLCQQCEQAPCEVVCPVHATVHSAEGLNDMVYNRCVGTRYCSNNCPYKVRRFNFLLYQDWNTPEYMLMRNPEVSIRSRGVMEKCTYCTQKISAARIEAEKDGGREIRDGEVVTACQAACPTDAILFGNLHDENSLVAKAKKDKRNYMLLNELNTQPRTTYLAELKNQNTEMPDYRPPAEKKHHPKSKPEGHETNAEEKH